VRIDAGKPLNVALQWNADDIQPVGGLAYRDGIAYLQYDESFLTAGLELSPVRHSTSTGLQRPCKEDVFEGLHGVFNDSLPDGWGRMLLDRRARQLGIEPATLTPLDRLACVGRNAIGALTYAPASDVWEQRKDTLDLDKLAADARLVLEGDIGDVISELGQAGGSPGGARPKALVAVSDSGHAVHGTDDIPDGYTHYLVKFAGHDDPQDIAAIEMAYAMMAKDAGVTMPETRLLKGDRGQLHFAARRFDREGKQRVHVHSASGLLYTDIRTPALDYEDLIRLTRELTHDQRECNAMFTLAVFNVLAHNRDDHARQFSFIMQRDGTWHMAPAYDLTCSPGPGGEHSSSVLGHGKDITRAQLLALGRKADIGDQDAERIIERAEIAIGNWKTYAAEHDVSGASTTRIASVFDKVRVQV
jgi:serine/threonine-protein kinase HipA